MQDHSTPSSTVTPLGAGLLRQIIDCAADGVLVVSAEDMLLADANRAACQMIGCAREDLLGRPLSSVECALQDLFFWDELRLAPNVHGRRVTESEWLTADGRSLPVEKSVTSHTEGGRTWWIIRGEDLTRRRQLAEEQVQLVSQLRSSLEATAEGIVSVDTEGRIVNLNHRFANMWGITEEVLATRSEKVLMNHLMGMLINSSNFAASLARLRQAPEAEIEETLALNDGRHFICSSKPEFLRDRLVGRVFSVRDITAIKRVEQDLVSARDAAELASREKSGMLDALRVSETHLRRLVNSSLVGIMQGDMSGRLNEANDLMLRLVGAGRQDLTSGALNWFDMTPPGEHPSFRVALEELRQKEQVAPFETELLGPEDELVPVMVGLARLEGSAREWVGSVLDLTEQRKAERAKSEFISVISHELRTPLTSIRGALSLLESGVAGVLPAKAVQLVQIAHKNSQRLGTMVNDILDMEKLMSGKMGLKVERLELVTLCSQAMEANATYAQGFGVKYRWGMHAPAAWVMADSDRVMQVLSNLLSNAAKFSPAGGTVEVRVTLGAGAYRVDVQDHGPGIPLQFRDHIFNKFAQADGSNTRKRGGSGLGLNIAKSMIEKMFGTIGFESEEGTGSTFWFTLPVAA